MVDRQFIADGPNRLWVTDLTFVPTLSGVAYVRVRRRVLTDDRLFTVVYRGSHLGPAEDQVGTGSKAGEHLEIDEIPQALDRKSVV